MREQPHYTDLLTEDFFIEHYVKGKMSFPEIAEMLQKRGLNIATGTVYKYAKKLGIGRTRAEGSQNKHEIPLDYSLSFETESFIEAIDGFLLGDGHLAVNENSTQKVARARGSLEHNEFAHYLIEHFKNHRPSVSSYKQSSMKSGVVYDGRTGSHPDFYKQHQRWYPNNHKQPPYDVRITTLSVMMWYLGDGSLVVNEEKQTVMLRLSTDGFSQERVEFLASKLYEKGIACHRNGDNRIQVEARGIPAFFDFIGHESPVACYSYKFALPKWRFEAKRMREVADELGIDYNQLSYWVKAGKVPCLRASENGKPRFLPEHMDAIREYAG